MYQCIYYDNLEFIYIVLCLEFHSNFVVTTYINYFTGVDYNPGPYEIKFPAGRTSAGFNISINNDDLLEDNETFNLIINPSSLPSEVSTSNPVQVTITVLNDEGK